MSRAFVKEDVDLPERSGRKRSASGLPPGATNYISARGAKRLRDELQKLRVANAGSERIIELERILASAHVVDPPDAPSNSVTFGATVTVKDKKRRDRNVYHRRRRRTRFWTRRRQLAFSYRQGTAGRRHGRLDYTRGRTKRENCENRIPNRLKTGGKDGSCLNSEGFRPPRLAG